LPLKRRSKKKKLQTNSSQKALKGSSLSFPLTLLLLPCGKGGGGEGAWQALRYELGFALLWAIDSKSVQVDLPESMQKCKMQQKVRH